VFEPLEAHQETNASRAVHLSVAVVVGIALVGFMVGIRQGTPIPELVPPIVNSAPSDPDSIVVKATAYRDFDRRQFGANRDWASNLGDLKQVVPDLMAEYSDSPVRDSLNDEQRLRYLAKRVQRRAFDGAPPVVPHPIDQMTTASCLVCHQQGLSLGQGVFAPKMSHPLYANCTQCHAEGASTEFAYQPLSANHFHGFWLTLGGSRAFEGAPPTIPHPIWMRENCMSCHGVVGPNPIRTSHPWRASCTQCHAPSAELDQFQPRLTRERE
jgi:nitrate reductase (cytochrome), electron transfer subunit